MATSRVQLSPATTPGFTHVGGLGEGSAKKASEFLVINHALYHTRWKATFHNHMVHHLLALWALGASPDEIQDMWDYNQPYQTPIEMGQPKPSEGKNLKDPMVYKECLGNNSCYGDFLKFFEDTIAEIGVVATLKEYLLKGDELAESVFCRMFSDLLHPVISLGCGLEFQQPSLIAEALAGACVHETWPELFLLPTEEYVRANKPAPSNSLLDTIKALHNDSAVRNGVKFTDPFNKLADGLLTRVTAEQLAPYLAQFQVKPEPEDLQRKMRDLMYTSMYIVAAAQQPGKRVALDFVTLHGATTSVFYPVILAQDGLSNEDKVRLLEAGARTSAMMYAACGSPALDTQRILDYQPRHPDHGWPELIHRSIVYRDEGHAAKLIRALYSTEQLGEPEPGFPIARADLVKIAHMGMDSIEMAFDDKNGNKLPAAAPGIMKRVGSGGEMVVNNMTRWVFYGGLEHAWDHVPNLEG
ncbi:hypothetical protein B0T22DRAFT_194798 [Podospora appendiculata]|uniref:Oxidoreductase AflY n=1 Tax=Podospora appendiculata TaxID=314037 RepID=A0AAE0XDQ5_9PEZI|nr:hypothetical protein B0T22DRAFT_194798 [Podospora appendiculata]